jgi:N-terminal glutamine amidase
VSEQSLDPEEGMTPASTASRCNFKYTSCYCEENVWLLCRQLCESGRASEHDLQVVFVSNPEQQVHNVQHPSRT